MRKRSSDRRLSLSKETVRNLIPGEMNMVAGGICTRRISRGGATACDCSGGSDTCGDCSTIQM